MAGFSAFFSIMVPLVKIHVLEIAGDMVKAYWTGEDRLFRGNRDRGGAAVASGEATVTRRSGEQ